MSCNQTLVGSGWDPKPNDKREIDRMAEYCLDMLKARGI